LLLASHPEFPHWNEFPIEVVEDDIVGAFVPVVEVELTTEIHGLAKRSRPLSFPEPASSDKNERLWSLHSLSAEGGDWGPPDVRQIEANIGMRG